MESPRPSIPGVGWSGRWADAIAATRINMKRKSRIRTCRGRVGSAPPPSKAVPAPVAQRIRAAGFYPARREFESLQGRAGQCIVYDGKPPAAVTVNRATWHPLAGAFPWTAAAARELFCTLVRESPAHYGRSGLVDSDTLILWRMPIGVGLTAARAPLTRRRSTETAAGR